MHDIFFQYSISMIYFSNYRYYVDYNMYKLNLVYIPITTTIQCPISIREVSFNTLQDKKLSRITKIKV